MNLKVVRIGIALGLAACLLAALVLGRGKPLPKEQNAQPTVPSFRVFLIQSCPAIVLKMYQPEAPPNKAKLELRRTSHQVLDTILSFTN